MQGLVGGVKYEDLGKTSLIKTQLLYLAVLHHKELDAKVHIDLKMTEFSGTAMAERERKAADPDEKKDEVNPADVERGKELAAEYRLSLDFPSWAPHHQAAYVRRHGWPGETPAETAKPYAGMTREVAAGILKVMNAGKLDERFTEGFWEQAPVDVEERLKATAKVEG